jgi:serine/threonine protein kinase
VAPHALSAGTRLGPYEILSALGAGGMGEVYRTRDTKLGHEVAIKILPDAFVTDPEHVARPLRARGSGARRAESSEHCRHLRA